MLVRVRLCVLNEPAPLWLTARRPTPAPWFYDILGSVKTCVVEKGVVAVDKGGNVLDAAGGKHALDVLVFATGFEVDLMPPFEVRFSF